MSEVAFAAETKLVKLHLVVKSDGFASIENVAYLTKSIKADAEAFHDLIKQIDAKYVDSEVESEAEEPQEDSVLTNQNLEVKTQPSDIENKLEQRLKPDVLVG